MRGQAEKARIRAVAVWSRLWGLALDLVWLASVILIVCLSGWSAAKLAQAQGWDLPGLLAFGKWVEETAVRLTQALRGGV